MRFGVLGPLAVWSADGDAVAVPDAKVRLLLADLLVEPGRVVSTDRLAEDLWGQGQPARPGNALHTLVSRLRKALAVAGGRDLVVRRAPGYLLRAGRDAVDAERFTYLAGRARRTTDPRERAARLAEALAQWRGPAFADFADEPFARAAADRLAERRLLAWEEFAAARLELGDHGPLAGDLRELVERHPLRERLREAQMRALYGAGRPTEALDVYQDVRRRLTEELGLEPGPALVALHRDILRHSPTAARAPQPATVPPTPRPTRPGSEATPPTTEPPTPGSPPLVSRTPPAGVPARVTDVTAPTTGPPGPYATTPEPPAPHPAPRAADPASHVEGTSPPVPRPAPNAEHPTPHTAPSAAYLSASRDAHREGSWRRAPLPVPATELIGRERSVTEVSALFDRARLVTLTGPGGVGKTRLAWEVARELGESFGDGACLVELSGLVPAPRPRAAGGEPAGPGLVGAPAWPGVPGSTRAAGPNRLADTADTADTADPAWPGARTHWAPAETWAADGPAQLVAASLGVRDDAWPGPWSEPGAGSLAEKLAEALRGRHLLLVLDNCEHVIDAVARLAQSLLRAAPGVRVLATSREPLGVAGEHLWQVPPLTVPAPGATPAEVLRSSAVRLFAARAAAAAPGYVVTERDAAAVATICRRVDGIPLALELASTRVRVLGAARLAERLDDRFGLLTGGRRDAPARQRTLRAVIDWSWELLTSAEQTVLRRLAIHSDGCALDAAEALCPGGGVKSAEVVGLLARLVDRSLVVVVDTPDGPRYRLLESVAAYGHERMRATAPTTPTRGVTPTPDGPAPATPHPASAPHAVPAASEYEQARVAHARYYTRLAERANGPLRGGDQQHWLRRLDAEAGNVRAALETARVTGDGRLARRLVRALAWYWFLRGRFSEARRSMAEALAVPDAPAPDSHHGVRAGADPAARSGSEPADEGRAAVAAWHAGMTLLCGDRAGLHADTPSPLRLHEAVHDPRERAEAGWFLGYTATLFGAMADGEELVRRALEGFRAAGDRWGVAAALSVRGVQRCARGELAASRSDGETSRELFRAVGDGWGQLQAAGVLGRLAEIEGDYRAAEAGHREALAIAEDLSLWTELSTRWSELGRIALLVGADARADALHERGRQVALAHGDRRAQEFAEVGLALGARRQGRLDVAEAYLRTWLEWNRQLAAANGSALILAELGFLAELRGDVQAASDLHLAGLAAARDTGDPRALALALEGLAGVRHLAGQPERAASLLGTAARARAAVGAPLPPAESGDVSRITAAVRQTLGETDFATAYAREAEVP
ncbi:BTAD domain-containing putative transcriptional regulator [Streptomyces sp. NPDC057702]|uniref:AfsR/SARP family transcriptional regulator n=1 Tax=unclassified Streptomyces TaxID=2593676 RepID=UPI003695F5F9